MTTETQAGVAIRGGWVPWFGGAAWDTGGDKARAAGLPSDDPLATNLTNQKGA